jgi:acid stress-induced BolA-like protein IbaG/YrbA
MDIKEKIIKALSQALTIEYIRLEDDDGISGFVVSPQFEGMSTFDRQRLVEDALRNSTAALTPEERRQVLMIAGLSPVEYEAVGARIRVHRIKEMAGGAIEVLVDGGLSDTEFVRGVLNNQKGVRTTEPKRVSGALGVLMSFRAKGAEAAPLTKEKVLRILKEDSYIEVMPNA